MWKSSRASVTFSDPRLKAVALTGLLLLVGCSNSDGPPNELREIAPPADLEALSRDVQDQYRDYRGILDTLLADPAAAGPAQIGKAFGLLGMWYNLYEYFESAEACYLNAEQLDPGEIRWPYHRAHIHRRLGPVDRTREAFRRVLELQPDDVPALTWLGDVELLDGRQDDAEPLYRAALARDPSCVRARVGLGKVALARKAYPEAIRELEIALEQQPDGTETHYNLGMAYRGAGDFDRAEQHLAKGQGLDMWERVPPRLHDPLREELQSLRRDVMHKNRTAKNLIEEGHYREAVELLKKLVEEDPDTADWRINLAIGYQGLGDHAAAMREIEEAIERFPTRATVHYGRGVFRAARDDLAGAEQDYLHALEIDPKYLEARFNLGRLQQRDGRFEASLEHFDLAAELDPANPLPRYWREYGLIAIGRYAEARENLERDLQEVRDRDGNLRLLLARLLATAPDDRVRSGEDSLKLARDGFAARSDLAHAETLAMAWAEIGDFERALAWQQAAVTAAAALDERPVIARRTRERLEQYRSRRPVRTVWAAGEHPPVPVSVVAPVGEHRSP